MITFREAQNIIDSRAKSFDIENIPLEEADGRVLAETIYADRDYPPFNRSQMDGYAFNINDWENGVRKFRLTATVFAGQPVPPAPGSGECIKIMTGAAVPHPANVVIRREDAVENDGSVTFNIDQVLPFFNIAQQGEDLKKGGIAIEAFCICSPTVISTLAALGKTKLSVTKLPSVALFTTGNEVKPVSEDIGDAEIRNSNEWLLKSLLRQWQIKPSFKHIPDNVQELEENIRQALDKDIVILCGGVSAGDADFVPQVLEKLGVQLLFHKVALKPGKPVWCGEYPGGCIVFALPGNPFSCLVTFKLFIEPYLRLSSGLPPAGISTLPLNGQRVKKVSFDEFFPARISGKPAMLEIMQINGSGDIRLGLHADVIALQPADKTVIENKTELEYLRLF